MERMGRICLFAAGNQYDTKRYFAHRLQEAFKEQETQTWLIDIDETPLSPALIEEITAFAPNATCSFGRLERLPEGSFLCDLLRIPHFSFLQSPSFYFTDLLQSPFSILTTTDQSDCQTIQQSGLSRVFFWPQAADHTLLNLPEKEKLYDLVFIGSCYDHESLRMAWRARNPEPLNQVLDQAIEILFSSFTKTVAEALVEAWNGSGCSPTGIDFSTLFTYLDYYTRGKERLDLIHSIKDATVHVFGELSENNPVGILSWQHYLANQSNVVVHPSLTYPNSLEILRQAKISLNSMPYCRHGAHERIFDAYACGALPLTSESTYLRSQFQENEEIVFFQNDRLDALNGRVNKLLADEEERRSAVSKGRSKVLQHHTWNQRSQDLQHFFTAI